MLNGLVQGLTRRTFDLWQALGLHVTPNHYSQPIPDTRRLQPRHWTTRSELVGIDLGEDRQLALMETLSAIYRQEYTRFPDKPRHSRGEYFRDNGQFMGVDADVLYSLIRHTRPRRIVEIGSGFSTCLATQAIAMNRSDDPDYRCDLTAIDPAPRDFLANGLPGLSRLVPRAVQDVPIGELIDLSAGDILFIDSSHVLRVGSDVQYEFLEVLPRLRPGVLVQVHDVFLPLEYPREWIVDRKWFYNEQYLLQAFLTYNRAFEVIWAGTYMHLKHPDRLQAAFPSYAPCLRWRNRVWLPGSFWMRRTDG